ncbi:hypothetical protein POM88_047073 [Heracleum sosnowskyi]|uniref:C2 domain-containing protein n=1 Tax=Heracleum sosnowskyi TaxID=360622 RepID=A0AAD8M7J7_9APIA|nr:hypothetical protein POM88_047073 [Heracleum sosnowskyi]
MANADVTAAPDDKRGGGGRGNGRPRSAPPDLPSLLLDARICYLGMPIVPAVKELLVAQFMWLDFDNPSKPIYLYINSSGTHSFTNLNSLLHETIYQNEKMETVEYETEAYAIADMMDYCKSDVYTVNCGMAFGQTAMLLSLGTKGYRAMQPNSSGTDIVISPCAHLCRWAGILLDKDLKPKILDFGLAKLDDFGFKGSETKDEGNRSASAVNPNEGEEMQDEGPVNEEQTNVNVNVILLMFYYSSPSGEINLLIYIAPSNQAQSFAAKLWSCNFNSHLANALIIQGDYQASLSSLEQAYMSATELHYPELQMFFATSILHVHLMQCDDVSLVEQAVNQCNLLQKNWMHLHFLRAIGTTLSMRAGIAADTVAALLFRVLPHPVINVKGRDDTLQELGRTEVVPKSLNPQWTTKHIITYYFEVVKTLVFHLYNVDEQFQDLEVKMLKLDELELLGEATCVLSEIITKSSRSLTIDLMYIEDSIGTNHHGKSGHLTICAEECVNSKITRELVLRCLDLERNF